MQSLKKYYFARQKAKVNTYIGGVGNVLTTPELLAGALGIRQNNIKLFRVIGNNIECSITTNYILSGYFNSNPFITYFYDNDGKIYDLRHGAFMATSNLFRLYLPGIIELSGTSIFADSPTKCIVELPNCLKINPYSFKNHSYSKSEKIYVIPKCANLGSPQEDDYLFHNSGGEALKVYVPISEQTSNSGNIDPDLAYILATGSSVVFVPNYISPESVINLTSGIITPNSVELNFTPPNSTNSIDFYEVYLNGIYKMRINGSGQSVTSLVTATSYQINIVAVDVYYNKSLISNSIQVTTT